jgi:hypothetical protein
MLLQSYVDHKSTSYRTEKSTTKAIALVDNKIDYMLLQRRIVKTLGKQQIDIEYLVFIKYAITSFHSIDWMIISVNVTIYRTVPLQTYQSSHCIMSTTKLLRSSI